MGETARALVTRFTEHLSDIRHNRNKPVAQHFNSANHTIMDLKVKGLWQILGDSFERKHTESHIIQRLGTMSPLGMNEKFRNSFILSIPAQLEREREKKKKEREGENMLVCVCGV